MKTSQDCAISKKEISTVSLKAAFLLARESAVVSRLQRNSPKRFIQKYWKTEKEEINLIELLDTL